MSKHDQAAEIFRRHDGKENAVSDAVFLYEQEHGDFEPTKFEVWLKGQRSARDYMFIGKTEKKNPYLWQSGPKRDAEIGRILKVLPTKAIRSLCAAADCDIAGRPLRGRTVA